MSDTTSTYTDEASRPWYRQPWLWFLLLFPAASIVYCIVAISIALNTHPSMVTDDYSKEGRGINQSLARDSRAAELGLEAMISQNNRKLEVELASTGDTAPEYLLLQLFHPTLGEQDRVIQLNAVEPGIYRGQIAGNIDGRWYFDLTGPSREWRIKGKGEFPAESGISIRAHDPARG
ncbi:MAG: FixH family protein [Marinobacter sp.]